MPIFLHSNCPDCGSRGYSVTSYEDAANGWEIFMCTDLDCADQRRAKGDRSKGWKVGIKPDNYGELVRL